MPAGALRGVHEVACALELGQHFLLGSGRGGELRGARLEHALARLNGAPQTPDMAANGVEALPMDRNASSQAIALPSCGGHATRQPRPKNCEHRNDTVQA